MSIITMFRVILGVVLALAMVPPVVAQTVTIGNNTVLLLGTSNQGTVTTTGSGPITATATPNSGYAFTNWTANGVVVSSSPSYTFTPTSSVPLVANFAPVGTQFTVAVSASPSADGSVSGGGTFSGGSSDTVAAVANNGFNFVNWTQGGNVVSSSPSYTFTVNSNTTLVANFTPVSLAGNCGLVLGGAVTFCEPFDVVNSGIPSRTGALDPNVWGVSRTTGGNVNFGQQMYNTWGPTALIGCGGTTSTVVDPGDIVICNGQLREASNDNPTPDVGQGTVTALTMYPKQPFDFAGRTGTVSFDVSNDSQGTHAVWPEFWMTDLPVPGPFTHEGSWISLPANGFGVRFGSVALAGDEGDCPNGNNLSVTRWTVDSAVVVRNYIYEDTFGNSTSLTVNILDCVISSPVNSGVLNHIELRVTPSEIDVYATDAGVAASPTTLRKIASITNANLTLTRGLVWLEDIHYNAGKDNAMPNQSQHTFVWDNLAFDGPFPGRDFTYDALDDLTPYTGDGFTAGSVNLAKFSLGGQTASWNVLNVPANPQAAAARVLFNFNNETNPDPTTLTVIVNGHVTTVPWPYPDQQTYTWRTLAVTIPLTYLVAGTNVVQLGSNQAMISANVDIQLAGVPGAVPVLPGNSRTYP